MSENPSPPKKAYRPFGWQFWTVLAVIIFVLAGLSRPKVIRCPKNAPQTEAVSNLRQLGLALFEFETDYGAYPNDNTKLLVNQKHPGHGHKLSGKSSNALFRQLFATNIAGSEQMFYAKVPGVKKPDNDASPGEALRKGEVAFAYIAGLTTKGNPSRPIAFCPVIPGTDRFDPKPFEGKAVALRIDNSVSSYTINQDGHITDKEGNLLSPEHPVWNGKPPDLRYPE